MMTTWKPSSGNRKFNRFPWIIGDSGTAIWYSTVGGDTILTLLAGSNIQGMIDLSMADTSTLNVGNGLSISNTFVAGLPDIINSNGSPMVTSGTQVVVVDPTNLAAQDDHLSDLTGGISSTLETRLSGLRNGPGESVSAFGRGGSSSQYDMDYPFWIQGFGAWRQQDGSGAAVQTQQWLGGFVVGGDGGIGGDRRAGLFAGASWGGIEADNNSQDSDSQSYFLGAYASVPHGGLIVDLAVTGGYSDFDQRRQVANNLVAGGIETATADYGGWFVSPELTVTRPTVVMGHPLEGSLALRYAGLFLDGYTESGVAAPLTVGDRTVNIGVARLQLAAPKQRVLKNGGTLRYRIKGGLEARTNFGGETIDGALLGQNISFDPGGDDNILGGFVGLSGEYDTGGAWVLTAGTEGLVETSGSFQFSGQVGVKGRF